MTLDEKISELWRLTRGASNGAWAIAQRLSPKIDDSERDSAIIKSVRDQAQQAARLANEIVNEINEESWHQYLDSSALDE